MKKVSLVAMVVAVACTAPSQPIGGITPSGDIILIGACEPIHSLAQCSAEATCEAGCVGLCDCTCPGPEGFEGCLGCQACPAECFEFAACVAKEPGVVWIVTPDSLQFFDLPINSVRYAVSGRVPNEAMCVTVVWDFSNNDMAYERHCDDFFPGFPYVFLTPSAQGSCDQWEYGPNTTYVSASGCVDFADFGGSSTNSVNVDAKIESDLFTGTVRIADWL